ncbi:MAG: adenylate kinase [Bdellovibrio sp.]
MNIILFGALGSGKGTQSSRLVKQEGFFQLSTGDLLRSEVKVGSALGMSVKKILDSGTYVPDALMISLVKACLESRAGKSIIFDGFPRTMEQAVALDELLCDLGSLVHKAIFLKVPGTELLKRLIGRRVCTQCGAVYHVDSKPSRSEGVCDVCGGNCIQRPDDKEQVIAQRLQTYETHTAPLLDFYCRQGVLREINGTGSEADIFDEIKKVLRA